MKQATIQLEELSCPSCLTKVETAIKTVEGVDLDSVNVMFNASKAKVSFDEGKTTVEEIEQASNKVGYEVFSSKVR